MNRVGCVSGKFPRDVVLLKSLPCQWGQCTFCDYHKDNTIDSDGAVLENEKLLEGLVMETCIDKKYALQVLDSASFFDLPAQTVLSVLDIASKRYKVLIVESHAKYKKDMELLHDFMRTHGNGLHVIGQTGVETFNEYHREHVLRKGFGPVDPVVLSQTFNWVNLLIGWKGQTMSDIAQDIAIGMQYFGRVIVSVFQDNGTEIKADKQLMEEFYCSTLYQNLHYDTDIEFIDYDDSRAPDVLGGVGR